MSRAAMGNGSVISRDGYEVEDFDASRVYDRVPLPYAVIAEHQNVVQAVAHDFSALGIVRADAERELATCGQICNVSVFGYWDPSARAPRAQEAAKLRQVY